MLVVLTSLPQLHVFRLICCLLPNAAYTPYTVLAFSILLLVLLSLVLSYRSATCKSTKAHDQRKVRP
jgi:uncharacterized membrane protein